MRRAVRRRMTLPLSAGRSTPAAERVADSAEASAWVDTGSGAAG
jgi:hypothetical protein